MVVAMFDYEDTIFLNSITMEYMPDSVLQHIYNYVPYSSYDYMDGLVELFVIADGRDAAGAPATGAGHAARVCAH